MSPRSRHTSMSSRTHTQESRKLSLQPYSRPSTGSVMDSMPASSYHIGSQPEHSLSLDSTVWPEHSPLHFDASDDDQYDAMNVDFVDPVMLSLPTDIYYSSRTFYNPTSQGPMSQTLSVPYTGHILEDEMMKTSPILSQEPSTYQHHVMRHGLPSPPMEYNLMTSDTTMDNACDMSFSVLPSSAMEPDFDYEKSVLTSLPKSSSQPRPIRSASERTNINQIARPTQDTQFSREDRVDKVKARNDPRYEQGPDKNGYFHCPYINDATCTHKPTKQRCIYAKYLDSHLKPYVCKHGKGKDCENLRFSSNACLFRHEREAHGLHNHGLNPFPCLYPGCERARKDNGFPRRWNQRDHMKRVHDWKEPTDDEDVSGMPEPTRRRKQSGSNTNGVQMKRSTSSHARAQAATYAHASRNNASLDRYQAQLDMQMQAAPLTHCPVSLADLQYSSTSMAPVYPSITRNTSPYSGGTYAQMVY